MNFSFKHGDVATLKTPCLLIGVYEQQVLTPSAAAIDKASDGYITKLLKQGDFEGKLKQTQTIACLPGLTAERIILIGCGKKDTLNALTFRQLLTRAASAALATQAKSAVCALTEVSVAERAADWHVYHIAQAFTQATYRFDTYKSKQAPAPKLTKIVLLEPTTDQPKTALSRAAQHGNAVAQGMALTCDLANTPGNDCHPAYLAQYAKKLATRFKPLNVQVMDEKAIKTAGMGAFTAVTQGSSQPGKLITMNYRGGKRQDAPHVLVGKGITFDTGGISLKPPAQMDEMKYDMGGAAAVFGTMLTVALLELPLNVIGVVAAAENMPSGDATRPGDIVKTLSGQTVEILNTDAEGRLVLCDTLTYVEKFKPAAVIDIATLTGACLVALGNHASGLLANNDALADQLQDAADTSFDKIWRLPLWEEYQESLDSPFADMANIGGRNAGTITAGCFLSRFAQKYPWAHLDIAGTAWRSGKNKGATGRPVPLLTQYLINQL